MHTLHVGERWHKSEHLVTTDESNNDISAFAPSWHQALYRGLEEIGVKCLQPVCDSLLHVGVWYAAGFFFMGPKG